jgi:hypothetical protein
VHANKAVATSSTLIIVIMKSLPRVADAPDVKHPPALLDL